MQHAYQNIIKKINKETIQTKVGATPNPLKKPKTRKNKMVSEEITRTHGRNPNPPKATQVSNTT